MERSSFFIGKAAMPISDINANEICNYYEEKIAKFTNEISSFIIVKFNYLEMRIVKIDSIPHRTGHGKMKLPKNLERKKAVINVSNNGDKCFIYAILSVLHYNPQAHMGRTSFYEEYMTSLNVKNIQFPFTIGQINNFHRQNPNIAVNILQWDENECQAKPLLCAPRSAERRVVNVLLVENGEQSHFVGVPNINRLLNNNKYQNHNSLHYCHRCLYPFYSQEKLNEHLLLCIDNIIQNCKIPMDSAYQFHNHSAAVSPSHVIFADIE